jgi:predicted ATPase/DNA-binding SARP family transcriptional activator
MADGRVVSVTVSIRLLGRFGIEVGGGPVDTPWRLRKAKTLVKLVALAPGRRVHRDVLIEQLWPHGDGASGVNNLHQVMHAARRVIGADHLVLRDGVVVLGGDGKVSVDVDDFAALASTALVSGAADDLRRALDAWGGELLPEDLYEDWAAPHRDRLSAMRNRLVAELTAHLVAEGRTDDAVALLEPTAAEWPTDEALQRSLVVALAAAGRRLEAAAAFERFRDALEADLGLAPEPETVAVYRRLFIGGTPGPHAGPHNLPTLSTSFVGRQRQLTELGVHLDRTRLLTLIGPGGAGKTRLAIELAHRQAGGGRRRDGVWLVELAGVIDSDGVPSAVASGLGLPLPGDRPWIVAVVEQLATRDLLLVLDNCEHVLPTVVPLTTELLARCPDVVVLATSREPFGLAAELAWRVPSLELPGGDLDDDPAQLARLESVQLFVERARAVSPSFLLDGATAAAVAEICRRLDGIPLALELAAARVAHLSPSQLVTRLSDALTVLARHGHGRLDRQQTLAATLDWSHDLLLEDERTAFRRLAVLAGGFDLDAANAVCGDFDVADVLARLVDKSLVAGDTTGDAARYRMLEVVRQYADTHLRAAGELSSCRTRHRVWYAGEAARHDPDRGVPVALEPSPWFDVEQDNLRAAFSSAIGDDACVALRLAVSTWRFLLSRGQLAEGLAWLTAALDACPDIGPERARALFAKGVLQVRRADLASVATIGDEIVEVCRAVGDDRAVAAALDQASIFTLMAHDVPKAERLSAAARVQGASAPSTHACTSHFAGVLALASGDAEQARGLLRDAVAALEVVDDETPPFFTTLTVCWVVDDRGAMPLPIGEETMLLGRRVGAAQARGHIAVAAALAERIGGRVDAALDLLDDAGRRFAALDDAYGLAYAVSQRGHTLRWAGDLRAARVCFDDAEVIRRSLRDLRAVAMTLAGRAYVESLLGDAASARAQARDGVSMMRRTGDLPGVAICLNTVSLIERGLGQTSAAAAALAESVAMADWVTPPHAIGWQYLLLAGTQHDLGHADASSEAVLEASTRFDRLGDVRGRRAVQRARKAGVVTMSS